jgi:hypothetical protein
VKLPRATSRRRQKDQIATKEKGKDYNLLPSPKHPKSLQSGLIIFFSSLSVNENLCQNIPQIFAFHHRFDILSKIKLHGGA